MRSSYFQRVRWLHENPENPVVLWAHVVDGWEAAFELVWRRVRARAGA